MRRAEGATEARILVVDDEAYLREEWIRILDRKGYAAAGVSNGKEALEHVERTPVDLMLLDLHLKRRMSGIDVLHEMVASRPAVPVIMISGKASIKQAVEATQLGAYDFLEKPVGPQRILVTVRNALEKARLQRERDRLLGEVHQRYRMIGQSPAMERVYTLIDKAARTASKVLITGESGTGKELTARAIHLNSARAEGPFVTVNCAAVPESLIESELFGHEKGAFTDAKRARAGKFEQADGGTLFLDEVGDMSLMAQAKVLRVLQEGRVQRIGGQAPRDVAVRVVAATNKDLKAEIEAGTFRDDLYYRLNVIQIELPPLRARREDIPALARHFATQVSSQQGRAERSLTAGAIVELMSRPWPGNVRELRNVIERLVALSDGPEIDALAVQQAVHAAATDEPAAPSNLDLRAARQQLERALIRQALAASEGRMQEAADALGINRTYLWKLMNRYAIEASEVG
jgi:two-component system nitrogen regulation response regulator NtrX